MAYSAKSSELVHLAMNYFSKMEDYVGREIKRRLEEIKQERENPENKKRHKLLQELDNQETELRSQLKAEQNEFVSTLDILQKTSAKLELIKEQNIRLAVEMESQIMETFQNHRVVRLKNQRKKEISTLPVEMTKEEILASAQKEIKDKEKPTSRVVKKDKIPDGFKPIN
jgi:hypothetical protein